MDRLKQSRVPRLAVVGCGWFAREAHLPALRRLVQEQRIDVTAICSRSDDSLDCAQRLLEQPSIARYTSLQDLLAHDAIDVVDLVLPTPAMPDAIRSTLRSGLHVISEKPCAANIALCEDLLAEYGECPASQRWVVAENWRFKELTQRITQIVRSGELGAIRFVDFNYETMGWPKDDGWRNAPEYTSGCLLDSGVHFVALLRRVIGEIEHVNAHLRQRSLRGSSGESVSSVVRFSNGADGLFRLSFDSDGDRRQSFSVKGDRGVLTAAFFRGVITVSSRNGTRTMRVTNDTWVLGGVYETLRYAIDTLKVPSDEESSPWEALRDVAVIEAMIHSGRMKRAVRPASLHRFLHVKSQSSETYQRQRNVKPRYFAMCSSVSEVQQAVVEALEHGLRVRATGAAHSWSPYLQTDQVSIQTLGLNDTIDVDVPGKTVRVSAGVRLRKLTSELAKHGLCLPSLPFTGDVTVGGAVATATHGTSPKWGTLSDFVRSMTFVNASGEVVTLGPDSKSEELRAARVAIGMLGVVVEVELEVVEMPWILYSELEMNIDSFVGRQKELSAKYDHIWGHWHFGTDVVSINCMEVSHCPRKGFREYVVGDNAFWCAVPSSPSRMSVPGVVTKLVRPLKKLLNKTAAGCLPEQADVAESGSRMSMQYAVPLVKLDTAVAQIKLSGFPSRNARREIELKFLKGQDRSYLGPNADQDVVLFNLWWQVPDDETSTIFDSFESVMRDLKARPHWGKLHRTPDIEYLREAFPHWDDFESVRSHFDPNRIFEAIQQHCVGAQ